MGPDVDVVGGMRHHLDDVGVHVFRMNHTIALYIVLGIAGVSSENDRRSPVVEHGFQDVAVKGEIDIPRAFQNP